MKIIQLIQRPQARGVELFTAMLSEELQRLGHVVILISIFEGDYCLPFSGKQIHLKRLIKKRFFDMKAWKEFSRIVKNESPDIIQANAADTLKFSVFSKKIFGWNTPILFRNASQISFYINSPWVKFFNNYLYKNIAGVISVSNKSKEDFQSLFNFSKAHQVIPIGIRIPTNQTHLESVDYPLLVHIGGFSYEKNHLDLIDIFSNIHSQIPELKLWLIGEGALKEEIKEKVKKFSLKDSVIFKGAIPNPFEIIPRNAIFVLPSKIEGLPAVILEAFAYKIPVIAYNVGGIPEVLINEKTGYLIPKSDQMAFKDKIIQILQKDIEDLNPMLNSAFEVYRNSFKIEAVSKSFEKFYKMILSCKTDK
ncbi:glycosyltransferase family 4 protein [Algoriphagus sp. PAP.12]|uniref:glycosyltransferase family 4 protein n=1 Tax=Algoriphagus sp. PAP.12 TaxID=2996678 RepID=UPI00227B8829|nr:glycosyltransferase family 4 protein [Algoriphagus sp. PAP.12]